MFRLIIIALVAVVSTVAGLSRAPEFVLNLDLPPDARWVGAVDLILSTYSYETSFKPVFDKYIPRFSIYPPTTGGVLLQHLKSNFPETYGEILGIVNALQRHGYYQLTAEIGAMQFYLYELDHIKKNESHITDDRSCCGILSLPLNASAPILHGRNMDEKPASGRNLTLDISVMKDGFEIYRSYDWTWFMGGGLWTGNRPGLTLELNWRDQGPDIETRSYKAVMTRLLNNATVPINRAFRHVLENGLSFDQALAFLNSSLFGSPWYVIMSGSGRRGAILTVFWNATDNVVAQLNDDVAATTGKWFVVQTNYDRWLPDPADDPRRTVAEGALTMMGRERGGSPWGVWMALSTYPVHNVDTFFTLMMDAEKPRGEGYVRVSMLPSN